MLVEIADPGVDISLNHTAAFVRNEADVPRRRQVGSLTWLGVLNTHHWIKPASGIAAVLLTLSLLALDPRFHDGYAESSTASGLTR